MMAGRILESIPGWAPTMDRDNTPVGRWTAREDATVRPEPSVDAGGDVMEAYDEIDGVSSYVLAAMDADEAWVAVPEGVECDSTEWR